ncbi:MAG TPA: DUF2948 family protein [Methyloceanibacter sp.]|nr:DUF2948 family protein [Methyloceanibacter sp.]
MTALKLIAFDAEDLGVLSTHLQDAVLRVSDMTYVPGQKRFAAVVNRFNWETAVKTGDKTAYQRRRAGLRFDRVLRAQLKNVKPTVEERVLSLLAIQFEPTDTPSGRVTLTFSGDAAIQLDVECIEAELRDLGLEWDTKFKPKHPGLEPGGEAGS